MSGIFSSLPPYPKGPGSELPPPRWDWGIVLWSGFAAAVVAALGALLHAIAPGSFVFVLGAETLRVLAGMLIGCGLALLALFIYVWQRSERLDR